jgi:hypothetical protein
VKKKKKERKRPEKKNTTVQIGTNVRVRGFYAGLLARSQLHLEGPVTGQLKVFRGFPWSQSKC